MTASRYIRWFDELSIADLPLVGGKNAALGELIGALAPLGVRVPRGFAVTAEAYRDALGGGAMNELRRLFNELDKNNLDALKRAAAAARAIVMLAPLPLGLEQAILTAYAALREACGPDVTLAVRSSATAEDLPDASFAGQHESYLNVEGDAELLRAVKRCQASLFTDRAISYRIDKGFDHFKVALSVGVMQMVRADLGAAGVMFTLDTDSGHPDVVFVTGAYGLGENVVQGAVGVDEFYVHKPTYRSGARTVLRRSLGAKQLRMITAPPGSDPPVVNVATPDIERRRFCISDDEVLALAGLGMRIEEHFSQRNGRPTPMDIEWARDGVDGKLYILQARPETVVSNRSSDAGLLQTYRLVKAGEPLLTGRAVGSRIAAGTGRIIRTPADLQKVGPGDVLVAATTTPDWEPVLKKAAAIVTDRGGRTCHAAIVARELGVPAVVGTGNGTAILHDGGPVTVSCAEGDVGRVYEGRLEYQVQAIDRATLSRPRTQIMVNVGNPEQAFQTSFLPVDGVGLARMEFIISEAIRAHPMALLHPDKVALAGERQAIAELIAPHAEGRTFFVEKLSEGVGTIAAAFWPRPVIVRLSDFKTNEYAALLGGAAFEPREENPMLGFRGAARYLHPAYAEGFALECRALRRVRRDMGLTNLKIMVPFCRTIAEAHNVVAALAANGLVRGEDGLEIFVMCEIPNNVLQLAAFAEYFDGFSIGSNDLTQLTLGVDRDSALVAGSFDENDPGMREMLRLAVDGCRRAGRHSGICGQAPSDRPEVARYLVELGIDSISVTPDSVARTLETVAAAERSLGRTPVTTP